MDVSNIKKLSSEEREFFLGVDSHEAWVDSVFKKYKKPLAVGIGLQNQFLDDVNQTVKQWKNSILLKKFLSLKTFKRLNKRKVYFQFIGPFPDYFYQHHQLNHEFSRCIKLYLEIFFPGKTVIFIGERSYKELEIGTRFHESSQQLQLFLPGKLLYCIFLFLIVLML